MSKYILECSAYLIINGTSFNWSISQRRWV